MREVGSAAWDVHSSGERDQDWRRREALGVIWRPAPTSCRAEADSRTVISEEEEGRERESWMLAPRPPRPAPIIRILRAGWVGWD